MTKDNAHLYLPLVQALAEGKTLQIHPPNMPGVWMDVCDPIYFSDPPDRYRIKPEPVVVPLGPEDVPPGSVFRLLEVVGGRSWIAPHTVEEGCVSWSSQLGDSLMPARLSFGELMRIGYEIKRPDEDWTPCCKPATD